MALSVYPGIDMKFYGSNRELEHDFLLAPGADPRQIRMRFRGARSKRLDSNGNLVFTLTDERTILQRRPVAYQETANGKVGVRANYAISRDGTVSFALGAYDERLALVIDPALQYGTYLGGSGDDEAHGIAVDASGAAYVAGTTVSTNFPTKSAYDGAANGQDDVFVAKIAPSGTELVYATYIGGSQADRAHGLALDSPGAVYVTGWTGSSDFPTVNAFDSTFNGGNDAFVFKLSADGSALVPRFLAEPKPTGVKQSRSMAPGLHASRGGRNPISGFRHRMPTSPRCLGGCTQTHSSPN
jgi:hypothetical protein